MFRLGSATRVLDLLLDTLSQKLNIQSSDPIDVENPMSCLYFDAVLLKSEVFYSVDELTANKAKAIYVGILGWK